MSIDSADYQYMSRAIQLAEKGRYTTHPNPRVGCVIVKDNQIIGEGWHKRAGQAHAEINALRAIKHSVKDSAEGATAYVTLEPCSHTGKTPPCANALIDARVSRVVVAMQDPNPQVSGQGIKRLQEAGIAVQSGILEGQARALNLGFIKRMEQGIPWLRVKLAMSLDGRTAMASGESKWITGPEARKDVQRYRASADAILTGIGTVLADDPSLNVRLSADDLNIDGEVRQPARVILDTQLRIPLDSKLLSIEGHTIILNACDDKTKIKALDSLGISLTTIPQVDNKHLSLKASLQALAKQEINEIHTEAGATLCGALLLEGLVDEIILYVAPSFLGSSARGLLNLPGLESMKDKIELNIQDIRSVGDDWRITTTL